jgi:hypothetical protein
VCCLQQTEVLESMKLTRWKQDMDGCWDSDPKGDWVDSDDVTDLEAKLKEVEKQRDDAVRLAMARMSAETYLKMEAEIEDLRATISQAIEYLTDGYKAPEQQRELALEELRSQGL